ncbi:hypothetical protein ACFW81_02455 [Streptomyces angustmyceticus]|uniref:hypothetical protein n=1 Tax=Streptomyces angustmyceticus TaxID=285578 RepID=UPI0036AB9330
MNQPSEHMRRLPWNGPEGTADYAAHGLVDHIADRTEADIVSRARNDAAYSLIMSQRPEASREDLCRLVAKLAGHVRDVASVADMREERLNSPAAKALEGALRAALGQH